jgi:L-rhamnonate dehydratase
MKIIGIRLRQLEGSMESTASEERIRVPLDIYPEYRERGAEMAILQKVDLGNNREKVVGTFLQIDTDEGISGLAGPFTFQPAAYYIDTQLRPILIGQDPLATEYLWDVMYRISAHGRKGDYMHAVSYVDIALWDIKGKYFNQPVYRLLGGPVQQKIPVYASTVGFSLEPERVKERVKMLRAEGFKGTKWFLREGPPEGNAGIRKNLAVVAAAREASGPDMGVMVDAWKGWDIPYTLQMAALLTEYNVSWIEEPLLPDNYADMAALRKASPVRISGGEHEYTRWGARLMMDMGCLDIYQFDPLWAGGISEIMKIFAMASAKNVLFLVHGTSVPLAAQVSFTQNAAVSPMLEYLYNIAPHEQHFLKYPLTPVDGYVTPPPAPGVGLDIDMNKVESEREIKFH